MDCMDSVIVCDLRKRNVYEKRKWKMENNSQDGSGQRRVSSGTLCGTDSGRTIPVSEE